MRPPKVTIRRMLLIIAISALPMWIAADKRRDHYLRKSDSNAFIERRRIDEYKSLSPGGTKRNLLLNRGFIARSIDDRVIWVKGMVDYHADLKRKNRRAAWLPWGRDTPDPPRPPVPTSIARAKPER
ncbi:hypothetical protein SAMN05444166_4683 [Singulisphaera sp. GP187]|uniref:hypothetical protein n=1 Tax=Singulisphaera sp. GP187 TaxID=1882752 RepID=UPI00092C769F|nr:hypothetical protein [Singulisphaera sp. GP187]SIO43329.1 hypothetical protein SAMN05444166_4683 [Singulisphaera sp. GP187]